MQIWFFTYHSYFLVSILFYSYAVADTTVSGTIDENTTWDISGSPYILNGNVTILNGVTLTINPGVVITADSGYSLSINGRLEADQITLSLTGADLEFQSGSSGWVSSSTLSFYKRIGFASGAGTSIASTDVLIEDNQIIGSTQLTNGAGITIRAGSPTIRSNTITGYSGGPLISGIIINGASPALSYNEITQSTYGIFLIGTEGTPSAPEIYNNIISNSETGIFVNPNCLPIANDNDIYNNGVGVSYPSQPFINFQYNWWGSSTGPNHENNPGGNGDIVEGNVDYSNWLKYPANIDYYTERDFNGDNYVDLLWRHGTRSKCHLVDGWYVFGFSGMAGYSVRYQLGNC